MSNPRSKKFAPCLHRSLLSLFALLTFGVFVNSPAFAEDWSIGKIVGLCRGTQIREGPGTNYRAHTTVPENDWAVKIIGGPTNGDWWDTSRKAAGDPSGGTGWVKKSEAESCKQSPPPPNPTSPQLTSGVSLSRTQAAPGDRVEGSFTVRNNGGQDWRPQRLGIKVEGPSYLDFGWREGLTIRPGESYTFQGAVPNAPGTTGTYYVSATWQDSSGNWQSLGGNNSFRVEKVSPPPNPASPQLTSGVSLSRTQAAPGDRVEGSFTVRNNGGQDWRPQRLGIKVEGPSYLDFGWREGLTIRPGESYTFQGAVPNAPGTTGTYYVSATWQDSSGSWKSLGGNSSFRIEKSSLLLPSEPKIDFRADSSSISVGKCTTLGWDVENVRAVFLDGQGVEGHGTKQVCPSSTTTYNLRVVTYTGDQYRSVTVNVASQQPSSCPPASCTAGKDVDRDFFVQVVQRLKDVPMSAFAVDALIAWEPWEDTPACWNPLATTWKKEVVCNFNSKGVQQYQNQDMGVSATANTLNLSYYNAIRKMLRLETFDREGLRAALRTWGTCSGSGCDELLNKWQELWNARGSSPQSLGQPSISQQPAQPLSPSQIPVQQQPGQQPSSTTSLGSLTCSELGYSPGLVPPVLAAEVWCTQYVYNRPERKDLRDCWGGAFPDAYRWDDWARDTRPGGKSEKCPNIRVNPSVKGQPPDLHDIYPGDVAVWQPKCDGANPDKGHVAYVTGVHPETGTIDVEEANWTKSRKNIKVEDCMSFIHQIQGQSTSLPAQQQSQSTRPSTKSLWERFFDWVTSWFK